MALGGKTGRRALERFGAASDDGADETACFNARLVSSCVAPCLNDILFLSACCSP